MSTDDALRDALEAASFLELRALAFDAALFDVWADYAMRDDAGRVLLALAKREGKRVRLESAAKDRGML